MEVKIYKVPGVQSLSEVKLLATYKSDILLTYSILPTPTPSKIHEPFVTSGIAALCEWGFIGLSFLS